jgi:hypothetical protein
MNERIKQLVRESNLDVYGLGKERYRWEYTVEKFAELIVQECARLNLELSYELAGVIVDTEEGIGFDSVCLNTVKQVHNSLASRQLIEHFGVEE